MGAQGIQGGADGGSALERFQQLRDLARKKIDGDENRSRLSDLVKRKQTELYPRAVPAGPGGPGRAGSALEVPRPGAAAIMDAAAYGRMGNSQRLDKRPGLGRNIDIVA